ncbi:MAG TPA: SdpI family protein [Chitinophagaceae bacterium]|nr:SdpI family protein [Chitinophagaceae bacterium]
MNTFLKRAVWVLFAIPAAYLSIIWNALPQQVPMHYNIQGKVDRYGSKEELILMVGLLTAINIGVYFLLVNVHRIDPKQKYRGENVGVMRKLAFAICLFIAAILCVVLYSVQQGELTFRPSLIVIAIGLLFAVIGNYFYSIKPNYFAGIRTPWALENENNWKLTHQLGGKLWFAGGIAIAVAGFLLESWPLFALVMAVALVLLIVPIAYSYRLYAREKRIKRM